MHATPWSYPEHIPKLVPLLFWVLRRQIIAATGLDDDGSHHLASVG
jgi:hypothetical protein